MGTVLTIIAVVYVALGVLYWIGLFLVAIAGDILRALGFRRYR